LQVLEFAYLQPKTRTFLELLLISIILHSQPAESRNEERLIEIFIKAKDVPDLAPGLRFFLKKVVSKTDLAGSRQDSETVRWGCKVAGDVLKVIASSRVADE
jgi:nucleolar MIF4G domain-containing protein 1